MSMERSGSTRHLRKFERGDKVCVDGISGVCIYIRKAKVKPPSVMCIVELLSGKYDCFAMSSVKFA